MSLLSSYLSSERLLKTIRERDEVVNQRDHLTDLFAELREAESEQRAYIITGREEYLERYHEAAKMVSTRLFLMMQSLSFPYHQNPLVQELVHLIQQKMNELSDRSEIRKKEGFEAVQKRVVSSEGERIMENIRRLISQMITTQRAELREKNREIRELARQTFWLSWGGNGLAIFLVLFSLFTLHREKFRLKRVEEELERTNDVNRTLASASMVNLSKKEENPLQSTFVLISLSNLIQKVLGRMEKEGVEVLVEIPEEMQPLRSEPLNMQSILYHLLKYVFAHLDRGQVVLRVKTNPVSLEPTEIEVIQRHTQLSEHPDQSSFKALEEGDLAVAQSLSQMMGYQLEITSQLNQDVLYRLLFLPLPNPFLSELRGERSPLRKGAFPLTVLVIDNDANFRSALINSFKDLGCQVLSASTGEEGLHLAKKHPVDLITMDMLLSPMNGYDVVHELQNDPDLKVIPYAFISVVAKEIKGKIPGALAFFNKPINKSDLLTLLQQCRAQRR